MNNKLTINPDEISQEISQAIPFIRDLDIQHVELRSQNGKSIIDFTFDEAKLLARALKNENLEVAAYASPLFKWYLNADSPEVNYDHFYFEPRLSVDQKKSYITKAVQLSDLFECQRLRIFSYLRDPKLTVNDFINDELLHFAIDEARKYGVTLVMENEPICTVNKRAEVLDVLNGTPETIGLFFDVSNFNHVGDPLIEEDIAKFASRIAYIQCKNFIMNPDFQYVSLEEGQLDYQQIMMWFRNANLTETFINIETHLSQGKLDAIKRSFAHLRSILD